ncbi:sigma-70 family RNA polymerase sigma factor [Candidatus Dojkabacteria bacterium]|uniref:Sigma-70 family RNA polymerase sigma factor n=1 Tax=Candidatus Dojkabacteria bacterium TaxID=2099670 RepID=A0A955L1Z4_9BACT|nr:sigma-70 family RNA polymerase sigma factor [Candidatus Dojkabacteria bacterium]
MNNKDLLTKSYSDYAAEIFRFCMFKLNNREEAEDITSEAFIRLHEQNIAEINNVRAWLYKVSRNLIYDEFIRPTTKNLVEFTDMNKNEETINNSLKSLEKEAIDSETIEVVKVELQNLDDFTADIISMRIWGDMQFSEIAEAMDLKESAVKMRFYRGVDELKDNINKKGSKIKAITVPILLAGILGISTQPAYAFTAASSAAVATAVGSTLGFTLNTMINTKIAGTATTAGTGILATTAAKLIAGSAVLVAGAGVGIGAVAIQSNVPDQPQNEIVNQDNTKSNTDTGVVVSSTDAYVAIQNIFDVLGLPTHYGDPTPDNAPKISLDLDTAKAKFSADELSSKIGELNQMTSDYLIEFSWTQTNREVVGNASIYTTYTKGNQTIEEYVYASAGSPYHSFTFRDALPTNDSIDQSVSSKDELIADFNTLGTWTIEEDKIIRDTVINGVDVKGIFNDNSFPKCTNGQTFSTNVGVQMKSSEVTTLSVTNYLEAQGYTKCFTETFNRAGNIMFEKAGQVIYLSYSAGGSAVTESTPSVEIIFSY